MTDGLDTSSADKAREAEVREDYARIAAQILGTDSGTDPFAAAVKATRMPMIITDPQQRDNPVVFTNNAFCRLTGYSREEIIGRNCRFLQGPETDVRTVALIREAVENQRSIEIDIRNHRKDGTPFWNRLLMAPVHDAEGRLAYFFASQVDVTIERERLAGLESHNVALLAEVAGRFHAQQESEDRLRFATAAGRMGIWELDIETGRLSASSICKESFGRKPAEPFTYADMKDAVHPDDRQTMLAAIDRSIETGGDLEMEFRVVRPDRAVSWLEVRARVTKAADGSSLRMAGVTLDISRQKLTEARRLALLELNDRFRDLDDTADLSFAAAEILGRTLNVSRAGYGTIDPVAETITIEQDWNAPGIKSLAGMLKFREYGSYIHDLKHGETVIITDVDMDHRTMSTAEALKAISAASFINMPIVENGQFVALLYLNHAKPRVWPAEELEFIRDIADRVRIAIERRRAERSLRESEEHYRNASELNPQVAWTAAPDGKLDRVAARWREWTGTSGLGDTWGQGLHPDDVQYTVEAWGHCVATGEPYDVEHRVKMVSGDYRWARSRAYPRRDDKGNIVKWYGSTEDIHDRELAKAALHDLNNQLEQRVAERTAELEDAQNALRQSQKMEAVGQLTGGLAHDFNNLLTGITGGLELMKSRLEQGRYSEIDRYINAAQGAAKRAAALTHRLLAFSRRQTLAPKPIDINRLVADMEDLVRRTVGPAIKTEVVRAIGLWITSVDANQLENALLNLCVNARDAMPDGGRLTIETGNRWIDERFGREHDLEAGQYVSLCVSDTGTGMTPEVVSRAFDPFFTTKPIGMGTGLGLSMIYGFAKQSGGQVRIYSEVGAGTVVCIYLPRFLGEGEFAVPDLAEAEAPRSEQGETVLVIDDEPTVRMLVTEVLEDLGYAVIEAWDGPSGLKVLESDRKIDLVVTDVGLPGTMNGRQVADAGRARRPDLKVLFITGYAENAVLGNGYLERGMQVLTKPFVMEELARRIKQLLEQA
ncbi:MAG: PAS domain-containing protein [Beijerinckiaceae bacterium]|nr:PAS domain-containing protein [Beijerinckiaceae bacterium]